MLGYLTTTRKAVQTLTHSEMSRDSNSADLCMYYCIDRDPCMYRSWLNSDRNGLPYERNEVRTPGRRATALPRGQVYYNKRQYTKRLPRP